MDVKSAFLNGLLEEEVYVEQPPDLNKRLLEGQDCLLVQIYVDDIIFGATNDSLCKKFSKLMQGEFEMSMMGELNFFLGLQIKQCQEGIYISQSKYTKELLKKFGIEEGRTVSTPMATNVKIDKDEKGKSVDESKYRGMIGSLLYLTASRPDILHVVCLCAHFQSNPKESHMSAVKRIFRYLKALFNMVYFIQRMKNFLLKVICDSDWASCPLTRRSLTGWFVLLGSSPISWKTKKQHTMSRSSSEAEYRSMATVACELKWLKGLLKDMGVHQTAGIKLYCDSQSAIYIAQNPVFHERTKHIEVDCHFVRDAITKGLISPCYVHTPMQLAEFFTKALGKAQFEFLLCKLGV
ncbi:hypothetical protein DH2020_048401 [Rehmannia glutinosa]|uniref:Reverse transcriptase Ty1/copia-type domain-containing protein n=1 Tax=Rehmannia glutinosa TaxID=99300 RepID=A0ABR0U5V2_REHGL